MVMISVKVNYYTDKPDLHREKKTYWEFGDNHLANIFPNFNKIWAGVHP